MDRPLHLDSLPVAVPTTAATDPLAQPVLGVIIPACNEAATIGPLLQSVLSRPCVRQVIVVDDGSLDGTSGAARRATADPRLLILRHPMRQGKGAAVRTALASVEAPIVVIQDADLEYDPADYPRLIGPIIAGRADAVYGVRGLNGYTAHSYWAVRGDRFVTGIANILFNVYMRDLETGMKVMPTEIMRRLSLRRSGFDIEPEITARLLRLGYRIHEVPVSYYARTGVQGKKFTWREWVRAITTLVAIRLASPQRLFGELTPVPASQPLERNPTGPGAAA